MENAKWQSEALHQRPGYETVEFQLYLKVMKFCFISKIFKSFYYLIIPILSRIESTYYKTLTGLDSTF